MIPPERSEKDQRSAWRKLPWRTRRVVSRAVARGQLVDDPELRSIAAWQARRWRRFNLAVLFIYLANGIVQALLRAVGVLTHQNRPIGFVILAFVAFVVFVAIVIWSNRRLHRAELLNGGEAYARRDSDRPPRHGVLHSRG